MYRRSDIMTGLTIVETPFTLLHFCPQPRISHAQVPFMPHYRQVVCLYGVEMIRFFGSLLLGPSKFVIALRLMMSGDVELNPGPLDQGGLYRHR